MSNITEYKSSKKSIRLVESLAIISSPHCVVHNYIDKHTNEASKFVLFHEVIQGNNDMFYYRI